MKSAFTCDILNYPHLTVYVLIVGITSGKQIRIKGLNYLHGKHLSYKVEDLRSLETGLHLTSLFLPISDLKEGWNANYCLVIFSGTVIYELGLSQLGFEHTTFLYAREIV